MGSEVEEQTIGAELEDAVRRHDVATATYGLWIGAEPTFTDRHSQAAEWVAEGVGQDKDARAQQFIARFRERVPGAVVMRPLGRKYPRESQARFCYGLMMRRDGGALWSGPPDRLSDGIASAPQRRLITGFRHALMRALAALGWSTKLVDSAETHTARFLCRSGRDPLDLSPEDEAWLLRASIHSPALSQQTGEDTDQEECPQDILALTGNYLVMVHGGQGGDEHNQLWLELPAFGTVADFLPFLKCVQEACETERIASLGLRGFQPPVDDSVAWTTLTPDPAVLEINQAPQPSLAAFMASEQRTFALAAGVGLSPFRLYYNGEVTDSGGGGQITFGGRSPEDSPFFRYPALLPRLIRYVTKHPSLSYWFATRYVGASSQSPRADEGVREHFLELEVALEQLARAQQVTPEVLWASLRHFMADASGNPHRSELNIEKLQNPYLPGRGLLGLVELRAMAMPQTLEEAVARAMLFRAILAMLIESDREPVLTHWGDVLHDRFALPYYLREDLRQVCDDLTAAGLGLGAPVEALLLRGDRALSEPIPFRGAELHIEQGTEFWPLLGDVASQESGGSRLVDASTGRIQLALRGVDPRDVEDVQLSVSGYALPLRSEGGGAVRVTGVRYRSFSPMIGLHPLLPAETDLVVELRHRSGDACRVTLHSWRADGEAYDGLPRDLADARRRRFQRAVVTALSVDDCKEIRTAPKTAVTAHCLDLRRLPPRSAADGE